MYTVEVDKHTEGRRQKDTRRHHLSRG